MQPSTSVALNIADKGFPISVFNRTVSKVDETVARATEEGGLPLTGHHSPRDFVLSLSRPRSIIILVKVGPAVDQTISALSWFLEPRDAIIDGGNDWYEHTERRISEASSQGLLYLGMGVLGGEEGARRVPSLMPGGSRQAFDNVADILSKVAAQVDDGPCVTYVGPGGCGNFVKVVIYEAYDVLRKWTVQQAVELSVAAPTIVASLDCRYLSGLKEEREAASSVLEQARISNEALKASVGNVDKKRLIDDVRQALYASKIYSYAQGMNLFRAKSQEKGWNLNLGELARIWKEGDIIRARFLDRIKKAYDGMGTFLI
ncbi:hypothetical protein J5N97_013084 [Dioscorea zingiberensis]|uniref:phosphogluconate dehydrogenase (NADP(+)-dependent, decarboxylating) n=1 Tax=Dioscorea zingiberensis TaxID=325984 RepID=A0A9D5HIC2_9LILI|nr:hypothetical protein J5N97_013084 [Dioscorea zingiberensis]